MRSEFHITCSDHDTPTRYLRDYRKRIILDFRICGKESDLIRGGRHELGRIAAAIKSALRWRWEIKIKVGRGGAPPHILLYF